MGSTSAGTDQSSMMVISGSLQSWGSRSSTRQVERYLSEGHVRLTKPLAGPKAFLRRNPKLSVEDDIVPEKVKRWNQSYELIETSCRPANHCAPCTYPSCQRNVKLKKTAVRQFRKGGVGNAS